MKSIFIAFGMTLMAFVCFLSFCWYIQFDHTQNVTEMAVKRALMSTMVDYAEKDDFDGDDVLHTFENYFKELALSGYNYELTLSGFIQEPLFVHISCKVNNSTRLKGLSIAVDEAMIEELRE